MKSALDTETVKSDMEHGRFWYFIIMKSVPDITKKMSIDEYALMDYKMSDIGELGSRDICA